MAAAPQKIAIRRLVRGADGQMRSILVDAYSYTPIADTTGYKVVDVGDVPEQVHDVTQPDAATPVKVKTTTPTEPGSQNRGSGSLGNIPSISAPSKPSVNQTYSSAPTTKTQSSTVPSVGANMPVMDSTAPVSSTPNNNTTNATPGNSGVTQTPSNPPGYSNPNTGATPQNYSPATPNAAAFAAGNQYYTGNPKTYDFQNPNVSTPAPAPTSTGKENVAVNNGVVSTSQVQAGFGPGASTSANVSFGKGFEPTNYSPSTPNTAAANASETNFGRNPEDFNFKPSWGDASSTNSKSTPTTNYGSMYGDTGFGGGYVADGSQSSSAKETIDSAKTTQNATERSQAMGSVPDSATSPAAAAARGLVDRTPTQLSRIGLTIAGEVDPSTLANLTSPDPQAQADARAQVANIQATMENRAATAPWGTIEKTLTPGQYNSLMPGKYLDTSTANYTKYRDVLDSTVKDFYTGLNPPTNYNFTNYANTNPIAGVYKPPGWLNKIQDPTQVGPFTFGTDPAYANPGRYTPEAQANYSAAGADYGASGAYKTSPDYGTDSGWGNYGTGDNNYSYGGNYGQSSISPGWGNFAGANTGTVNNGGGYSSDSGNGNGRSSGLGSHDSGSSSYGGSGSSFGGSSEMSGGGGYSPGGMGSPSGSSNDGGGYGDYSSGSDGNNSGTGIGNGAGTNGSGSSRGAQGRSEGDY